MDISGPPPLRVCYLRTKAESRNYEKKKIFVENLDTVHNFHATKFQDQIQSTAQETKKTNLTVNSTQLNFVMNSMCLVLFTV